MRGLAGVAVLMLAACAGDADESALPDGAQDSVPAAPGASATPGGDSLSISFVDRSGQNAGGARLIRLDDGVEIAVRVTGLTPGEHGFHVHENGLCEPPAFASAGGHYAPEPKQHGLQNPQGPHAGDLPNLRAGADGVVDTIFRVDRLTFMDGAAPLIRRGGVALVVHADADDYRTDPSGNSGDRVACAVVIR